MTGFRIAKGCAQEYWGVTPDLTTMGKVIGGPASPSAPTVAAATSWTLSPPRVPVPGRYPLR